jgi:hypothetical protein
MKCGSSAKTVEADLFHLEGGWIAAHKVHGLVQRLERQAHLFQKFNISLVVAQPLQ